LASWLDAFLKWLQGFIILWAIGAVIAMMLLLLLTVLVPALRFVILTNMLTFMLLCMGLGLVIALIFQMPVAYIAVQAGLI
jgi:hypothetical protein